MPLLFRTQLIIMGQAHSRGITDASHSWVFVRPMRLASTYEVNNADWIRMGLLGVNGRWVTILNKEMKL